MGQAEIYYRYPENKALNPNAGKVQEILRTVTLLLKVSVRHLTLEEK